MTRTLLKIAHIVGLAMFLGSVFGHILTGVAVRTADPTAAAALQGFKHLSTLALTLPGLATIVASGLAMAALSPDVRRRRWVRVKLGLACLVAANGLLVLAPLGAELAAAPSPAQAATLTAKESLFGAINLGLVALILVLATGRPRLGGTA